MDRHVFGKTIWGLLLIGAGVLFMMNQTGQIHFDLGEAIGTFWPVILIYIGLTGLMFQRHGGSFIWSSIMILVGTYFLLENLNVDFVNHFNLWEFSGPIVLILIGLRMLTRAPGESERSARKRERREERREEHRIRRELHREKRELHRQKREERKFGQPFPTHREPEAPAADESLYREDFDKTFKERVESKFKNSSDPFPPAYGAVSNKSELDDLPPLTPPPTPPPPPPPYPSHQPQREEQRYGGWSDSTHRGTVNRANFIGDIYLGQDYWELEPTNVSHFIGDTVIDLTKARIPYGETKVTVSAFIGDVKVFVPNDIQVEVLVEASAFIGDMKVLDRHEGGMFRHVTHRTPHYSEAEKKIRLVVSMFIGDVSIQRVG